MLLVFGKGNVSTRFSNRANGLAATLVEVAMTIARASRLFLFAIAFLGLATACVRNVQAQPQQLQCPPVAGVIVIGEGSVSVAPDYAQIGAGVTVRASTVKEATDTNSQLMNAITAALLRKGIDPKDFQTSRFSIQPFYAPQETRTEPKLAGYSVSNQLNIKIREISKVGEIIDDLVTAGATDIGSIIFLVSNPSNVLDQAREAAIADARRKAAVYAHASGLQLGQVEWITEDPGFAQPFPMRAQGASSAIAAVPIVTGEDTLRARITVGFEIAR
jgi:uncharacterized protein YggE